MRFVVGIAAGVGVLLAAFGGGYGYHRDELYFLAAGRHLAWAYDDQGPLTPLIARVMDEIATDSLWALRLPSALMTAGIVLVTGLIAREFGADRAAAALAALCSAVGAVFLVAGHLLSTATFDLLAWTVFTWLIVRAVRTGHDLLWLYAGAVLGLALLNKPLIAFLAFGLLVSVAVAGPRRLLRSPWVWGGVAIALVMWAPWLVWQADHGWPQIDVAKDIAGGGSASSQPRWAFIPFVLLLVSPLLCFVWIAGLVRLWRSELYHFLALTWIFLVVVFIATGGKPYYVAGLFPLLLAAGAEPVADWAARGRARAGALVAALSLSLVVSTLIALPILPRGDLDPVLAVNPDAGETIGWPQFARTIARVNDDLGRPPRAVVLAGNYGEAGAVRRYGPALGLPQEYSNHNAYWRWGPPPDNASPVIAVGFGGPYLETLFDGCRPAARIRTPDGVDNDENGAPVYVCERPRLPWRQLWQEMQALG